MTKYLLRSTIVMALAWTGTALADDVKRVTDAAATPASSDAASKNDTATKKDTDAQPASSGKRSTVKKGKGHLPPGYKTIVDESQKAKIYQIEDDFNARIKVLTDQLKQLKTQRDAEIKAVLTPEQQKQVEQLAADSKAKRGKKGKSSAVSESANVKSDKPIDPSAAK